MAHLDRGNRILPTPHALQEILHVMMAYLQPDFCLPDDLAEDGFSVRIQLAPGGPDPAFVPDEPDSGGPGLNGQFHPIGIAAFGLELRMYIEQPAIGKFRDRLHFHRTGVVHVQGPLDLEFLRGRKMSLTLEPGQMALLIQEGGLKAVYLDGAHYLDVGHGPHQVPADSSLLFLAAERHINLNWSRQEPLEVGKDQHQTLIGDGVFVGSNSALVAPLEIESGATIGAGSTITKDAPADALTLTRAKQITLKGWKKPVKGD